MDTDSELRDIVYTHSAGGIHAHARERMHMRHFRVCRSLKHTYTYTSIISKIICLFRKNTRAHTFTIFPQYLWIPASGFSPKNEPRPYSL